MHKIAKATVSTLASLGALSACSAAPAEATGTSAQELNVTAANSALSNGKTCASTDISAVTWSDCDLPPGNLPSDQQAVCDTFKATALRSEINTLSGHLANTSDAELAATPAATRAWLLTTLKAADDADVAGKRT